MALPEVVIPLRLSRRNKGLLDHGVTIAGHLRLVRGEDNVYELRLTGTGESPFVEGEAPDGEA